MQLLPSLLCFVLAVAASHNAGFDGENATFDSVGLVNRSDLPELLAPENACVATFYQNGISKDMCGASTVASVMDPHCRLGTASLVDDCNALIQDIEDKNGGGFWGYANESTIVVASHDTCSFSVTIHNDVGLFNIGTEDVTDFSKSLGGFSFACLHVHSVLTWAK